MITEIASGPEFSSPKYAIAVLVPFAKLTSSDGVPATDFDAEKNPPPMSLRTTVVVPLLFTGAPTAFSSVIVMVTLVVALAAGVVVLSAMPTCVAVNPPTGKLWVTCSAAE